MIVDEADHDFNLAFELRQSKIRWCFAQDLVRLPEFSVLRSSAFTRSLTSEAQATRPAAVLFRLLHPEPKRLGCEPIFAAIEAIAAQREVPP